MDEKSDEMHQRLLQQSSEQNKPLPENDLHKGYGGERLSRRNLRGLLKTLWELIGKVEENTEAQKRLAERIDELINLK